MNPSLKHPGFPLMCMLGTPAMHIAFWFLCEKINGEISVVTTTHTPSADVPTLSMSMS